MRKKRSSAPDEKAAAAGNGLLDRRSLLSASNRQHGRADCPPAAAKKEIELEPWMEESGSPFVGYGQPSGPVMAPVRQLIRPVRMLNKGFWGRGYL
jgi:hypothetical protein